MSSRFFFALLIPALACAQNRPDAVAGIPVNYDEAKVGTYTLPELGKWTKQRRAEVLKLYAENQFGLAPGKPAGLTFDVFDKGTAALGGVATRRQVSIFLKADKTGPRIDVLLYVPANSTARVPVLLNASFVPNSITVDDPGVRPGEYWNPKTKKREPAVARGNFGRINAKRIVEAGFGFATVYYGDIDPDFAGARELGVRALYPEPAANEWGTIAAWAWGLSRVLDYLETDKAVDAKHVTLLGVSRLGKTLLWAAASDTRFGAVIASCSGEGGAALSRRNYGETIAHLAAESRFKYQFCLNYGKWGDKVNEFPVDAHMLVALIAPRPVLLQTGDTDFWSDPKGEFLAAVAAKPAFKALHATTFETDQMPAPGAYLDGTLAYYMHSGGHGIVPSDWDIYLKFLAGHGRKR